MSRNILVVGNCQIGGIAAALQRLFPSDLVSAVPVNPSALKGGGGGLTKRIASADIVLGGDFAHTFLKRQNIVPRHFLTIPRLYFSAFHPDIVGARIKSSGAGYPARYNSAICLWAFTNNIEPADASRLFNKHTFARLGYFNRWESSVAHMKTAFESTGFDFNRFFLAVKRDGIFMHTVNHPKVSLLIWMAKMLAVRIGHDKTVWNKEVFINDALGRVAIWPVYPEVAHELAMPGSYTWFVDKGKVIEGLRNYIEFAYDKYSRSGIDRADIEISGGGQAYLHSTLSATLKGK